MACSKNDCINNGVIILDANVFYYIIRSALILAHEAKPETNWVDLLPDVKNALSENLDLVSKCDICSGISSSCKVIDEELVVRKLRKIMCLPLNSQSVYTNAKIREINRIATDHITKAIFTHPNEVEDLRLHMIDAGVSTRSSLQDTDASILVAACKESHRGFPVIIVSDDTTHLEQPWAKLSTDGEIDILGTNYQTNNIRLRTYTGFIFKAHDCCECTTVRYKALFFAWFKPLMNIRPSVDQGVKHRLVQKGSIAVDLMTESVENKPNRG